MAYTFLCDAYDVTLAQEVGDSYSVDGWMDGRGDLVYWLFIGGNPRGMEVFCSTAGWEIWCLLAGTFAPIDVRQVWLVVWTVLV